MKWSWQGLARLWKQIQALFSGSTTTRSASRSKRSRSLAATMTLAFAVLSVSMLLLEGSFQTVRNFGGQQAIAAGKQQVIALEAATEVSRFVEQILSALESAVQ